ncbi:putative Malate dehydrogenase [Fasciola gigantica]|uniref:Putative Malate dehydrogenase n=1 Tax=Fasciola gigantica TaxID=46835 RepID=A0A504YQ02_FASGI|nr:putative Malate dehydrogenase [Fasciola gigantica]
MTKVVIAGTCDCPYFARIELLADKLAQNLPRFNVTKVVKQPGEWKDFTNWVAKEHGWNVTKSPVVWRELLDQGGPGTLIGGSDEFQEYVAAYYKEYSSMTTKEMCDVSGDNTAFKAAEESEKRAEEEKRLPPSTILVIGASSPASVHLLSYLALHGLFGPNQYIQLDLYDDCNADLLHCFAESLLETSCGMLSDVHVVHDLVPSLKASKQIIFLDVVPRIQLGNEETASSHIKTTVPPLDQRKFEPRNQWLRRRYSFFSSIGLLVQTHCSPSVRILVAGNPGLDAESIKLASPINFDVAVLHKTTSPRISARQIVGLVGPIVQRVKASVAANLQVSTHDIVDVIVWGNVGSRTYIDLSQSRVYRRRGVDVGLTAGPWFSVPTMQAVRDTKWIYEEMPNDVFTKRSNVIPRYHGLSHAQSMISFLRGWWTGDFITKDQIISLVMASEDWYGIPKGVVFSFPVIPSTTCTWAVAEDIEISQPHGSELENCLKDVLEDWAVVDPTPLDAFIESRRVITKTEEGSSQAEEDEEM